VTALDDAARLAGTSDRDPLVKIWPRVVTAAKSRDERSRVPPRPREARASEGAYSARGRCHFCSRASSPEAARGTARPRL